MARSKPLTLTASLRLCYKLLMSHSHSIAPFPLVAEYFGNDGYAIITQEFTPGKGWTITGYNKRVSRAWVRKLKNQGVTSVALTVGPRTADFRVEELLKLDRRPMFAGNLIGAAIRPEA